MLANMLRAATSANMVYVGGKSVAIAETTRDTTIDLKNGTLTGGIGANADTNDLILVAYAVGGTGAHVLTVDSANAFGLLKVSYTEAVNIYRTEKTYDTTLYAGWTVLGATKSTVVVSGQGNTPYAGAVCIQVWRNIDTATPMDVSPVTTTAAGTGSNSPDAPAITPVTTGAVVVAIGALASQTVSTLTSSMDNVVAVANTDSSSVTLAMASKKWTSGAYDPPAFTGDTAGSQDSLCAASLAIRPK